MKILAVRDSAIDAFGVPFFVQHINQGIRSFIDEANRDDSPIHQHPSDYELFEVGDFDQATGVITSSTVTRLARAKDHQNGTQEPNL